MNTNNNKTALIYCRVSSDRQKNEGHGLDSQEQRCRVFANTDHLDIEKVFADSFTGGGDFMLRPKMRELLAYIDSNPYKEYTVIFDDLKRFARDTVFHIKLRKEFGARNVELKCLNFNFEDTPEGKFVETIMAAQGELEREQNKRQVIQKQKSRLEKGYWSFYAPPGFEYEKNSLHGKVLKQTSLAPTIKEAFEGFESGIFQSQTDVQEFLQSKQFCGRGKRVYLEKVKRLFSRPIYAGLIEYPKWEVKRMKGYHKVIISETTFDNVQRILTEGRRVRTRVDISKDFPLRGLVKSVNSDKPYTASFSKGRSNQYAYYRDTDKNSEYYNKSFKKETVESDMEKLFLDTKPSEEVIEFAKALIQSEWESRNKNKKIVEHDIQREIVQFEKEKEKLIERSLGTEKASMISIYEDKIEQANLVINDLQRKLGNSRVEIDFGTAFSEVIEYIKNPLKQWVDGDLKQKRTVVMTVFDGLAEYEPNVGFGTANLAPIYKVFEEIYASNSQHVDTPGIEPD